MKKLLTILGTLTVLLFLTSSTVNADFGDLLPNDPYAKAFNYLQEKGILKGYPDGTVRPDNLINRAELIKLLVEGFKLSVVIPDEPCFTDIRLNDWYTAPICAAKDRGIISGLPDGTFLPARNINKAEALKIIAKVTKLPSPTSESRFQDVKDSDWFTPFVIAAEEGNYLAESGPNFEAGANYSRGQIAEILYRILITQEQKIEKYVETPKPPSPTENEKNMLRWQIFALDDINRIRKEHGVDPIKMNPLLNTIATIHSQDMGLNIRAMSHEGSLREQAHERVKQGKVPDVYKLTFIKVPFPDDIAASGENVGKRNIQQFQGSVEKALQSQHAYFLDEPENEVNHRTTMLSKIYPFSEIGIGLFLDNEDNLWITEDFISTK